MAETKKNIMTFAGLRALEDELFDLKVYKRKEVAQKIKEAREQGDLSENAEYDAAKDEQRDIETEIAELEVILANCEVIQDNDKNKDVVKMESVVVLHDVEFDEDIEYTIVGSSEADSLNNKISNESPLGAALIGKKKGDTVKVEAPEERILRYLEKNILKDNAFTEEYLKNCIADAYGRLIAPAIEER